MTLIAVIYLSSIYHLSTYHLSIYLPIYHLSIYLPIYHLSIYLPIYHLSIYLSIHHHLSSHCLLASMVSRKNKLFNLTKNFLYVMSCSSCCLQNSLSLSFNGLIMLCLGMNLSCLEFIKLHEFVD